MKKFLSRIQNIFATPQSGPRDPDFKNPCHKRLKTGDVCICTSVSMAIWRYVCCVSVSLFCPWRKVFISVCPYPYLSVPIVCGGVQYMLCLYVHWGPFVHCQSYRLVRVILDSPKWTQRAPGIHFENQQPIGYLTAALMCLCRPNVSKSTMMSHGR